MSTIRVVSGVSSAPTAMSAYDAALADANVHNYNLIPVSSVIPAHATVEAVGTAPDLGPAGGRLTVVEAAAVTDGDSVSAGLGWTTGPGPGLVYEASGDDPESVRATVAAGLDAGRDLREWTFEDERIEVRTADPAAAESGDYTAAVVAAVYGRSEPIL